MQKLQDNQEILNSVMDKQNVRIKSVSKNGTKQFLQYYIDNNKLNELLPVQIILNSIFDRQTSSICISGVSGEGAQNSNLSNYVGSFNVTTSDGKNVISTSDDNVTIGDVDNTITINATDVLFNGNGVNTPNGFVVLNEVGKIDNKIIDLQFDPQKLSVVQNVDSLSLNQTQITIRNIDGTYKAVTLQQLTQLCSPKLQIYE